MDSILEEFVVFEKLPREIFDKIKYFNVSKKSENKLGFCVTNEDKVYGLGEDINKILGLNGSVGETNYILIEELCDKNTVEFFDGLHFLFSRTVRNEIYSWGANDWGQLARGYVSHTNHYLRPDRVRYFDDKNIIQISCGYGHCLALSSDGYIYGWGDCSNAGIPHLKKSVHSPQMLSMADQFRYRVKLVNCSVNDSYFITNDNLIYKSSHSGWQSLYDLDIFEMLERMSIKSTHKIRRQRSEGNYDDQEVNKRVKLISDNGKRSITEAQMKSAQKDSKPVQNSENGKGFKAFSYSDNCSTIEHVQSSTKVLEKFLISKDLPYSLDIKCYYESGKSDSFEYFVFFVMRNGTVFGLGNNRFGKLGLGNQERAEHQTQIFELNNIEEFYEGIYVMFARNDRNQIFGWGWNHHGQLGSGYLNEWNQYLKPQKINFFDNKNIIDISCGESHCLALSSEGRVYGWGDNSKGQIGCDYLEYVLIPCEINCTWSFDTIKYIHCYRNNSFAVSCKGQVYGWGQIMVKMPRIIDKIVKVYSQDENLYLLNQNGKVFKYDYFSKNLDQIEFDVPFNDISIEYQISKNIVFQSEDCVYEFDGKIPKMSDYFNFYDYYKQKHQIIHKTIKISDKGLLQTKEIFSSDNSSKRLDIRYKNIFENKYEKLFREYNYQGQFGRVVIAENKLKEKRFAIKKFKLMNNVSMVMDEIRFMTSVKNECVVKFIDSWIESKESEQTFSVYIQMELCQQNLKVMNQTLNNITEEKFKIFKYYISCELFKELTECVNYLHSSQPPIIHRDLKPQNILICDAVNGISLKLCDFGLSKCHEYKDNKHKEESIAYKAPEVRVLPKYKLKSDIYSLALIAAEIFHIKANVKELHQQKQLIHYQGIYSDSKLKLNFKKLLELISICLSEDYFQRPNCEEILIKINELTIDKQIVVNHENIEEFKNFLNSKEFSIIKKFFEIKSKSIKKSNKITVPMSYAAQRKKREETLSKLHQSLKPFQSDKSLLSSTSGRSSTLYQRDRPIVDKISVKEQQITIDKQKQMTDEKNELMKDKQWEKIQSRTRERIRRKYIKIKYGEKNIINYDEKREKDHDSGMSEKLLIHNVKAGDDLQTFKKSPGTIDMSDDIELKVIPTTAPKTELSNAYELSAKRRGLCVIINNVEELQQPDKYNQGLKGLENETKRFKSIFSQLFFEVNVLTKLTAIEIKERLTKISQENISRKDQAFVLIVISHGGNENVLGYNACEALRKINFKEIASKPDIREAEQEIMKDVVSIKELISLFSEDNCVNMRNKPKLHFFVCCRIKVSTEIDISPKMETVDQDEFVRFGQIRLATGKLDTFVSYACAQGYKSFYDSKTGLSYFGQALTHSIAQYACDAPLSGIMNRAITRLKQIYKELKKIEEDDFKLGKNKKMDDHLVIDGFGMEINTFAMDKQLYFNPGLAE